MKTSFYAGRRIQVENITDIFNPSRPGRRMAKVYCQSSKSSVHLHCVILSQQNSALKPGKNWTVRVGYEADLRAILIRLFQSGLIRTGM